MKKRASLPVQVLVLCFVILLVLVSGASAEEFSFFGARFGMSRTELDTTWLPLGDGVYVIPGPQFKNINASFDHSGRLYELTFAVELEFSEPSPLVGLAFQQFADSRWGRSNPDVEYNIGILGPVYKITVWDRVIKKEYIKHIEEKISTLFNP